MSWRSLLCFLFVLGFCYCAPEAPIVPSQIHLTWSHLPSEMIITFLTPNTTPDAYTPTCKYGEERNKYHTTVIGTTAEKYKCYTEAPRTHKIVLRNLKRGRRYYYIVGDPSQAWSEEYHFTAQQAEKSMYPLRFAFYGDMGITYSDNTIHQVQSLVDSKSIDAVLHVGDISYADDRVEKSHGTWYEGILDKFYDMIQNISARVPYMTSVGNHEHECDFIDYKTRNSVPWRESNSTTPMYYSYTAHRIHFISLSTEQHLQRPNPLNEGYIAPYTPQYKWLLNDLKLALEQKRNGTIDWIIATGHRPLYCSYNWSGCCWDECESSDWRKWKNLFTQNIESLLHDFEVDFYLCGHTHNYERTYPVYKGVPFGTADKNKFVNPDRLTHIMAGGPGDMEVMFTDWMPTPEWSAMHISTSDKNQPPPFNYAGFGKFHFYNATTVHFQYIRSSTGEVLDEFWLIKDQKQQTLPQIVIN